MTKAQRLTLSLLGASLLGGCTVGPKYQRPDPPVPVAFKEMSGWKEATPKDAIPSGAWWEVFQDPVLNQLEAGAAEANQTVQQAVANYQAARQAARAERSAFWPSIGATGLAERNLQRPGSGLINNQYEIGGAVTWSPDFWGQVIQMLNVDIANAQSSAATMVTTRLTIQSTLANDYITLRTLDVSRQLLINSAESYRRTLEIATNKYKAGVVARSDVITAQADLDSTRAQVINTGIQRAQLEHALAVLTGKAPADLTIAPRKDVGLTVPGVPASVPSQLLERRPDVAAAERTARAANAQIGVAVAAYFPTLTLTAGGGFENGVINNLFSLPNKYWTLGASGAETLFDFGQRRALVQEAKAQYNGAAANYRQTVLTAFQQVEDDLASLRLLKEESQVQQHAVDEAALASKIAENEYRAGTVDYTTVVTANVTELTNRETLLSLLASQLTSEVGLIQALGGGWTTAEIPSRQEVLKR
jgi:NodT family efflux transporter outer membrane factor (OMF) lipoprotein